MRVLVAGARGQLARSLLERASGSPEVELVTLGRPTLDLESPGSAARAVAATAPDVVINAAAYTAVDRAESEPALATRINANGAGKLAAAAAARGAAIIQLSTDFVFDGTAMGAYAEDAVPNPLNVYGKSKLAGEQQVRLSNPRHTIVRTAWVYSPFGQNFVTRMMAAAGDRRTLTVVDDQRGNPTSALDLADALLQIIARWANEPELGLGKTYHLAGPATMSWYDFALAIMDQCRELGLPAFQVVPIKSSEWAAIARRPANSALNSCSFAREFGYSTPPWTDSLAAVIERVARQL